MKALFDSKAPVNQRINKLEVVTTRLARRSQSQARVMLNPYPIHNTVIGEDVRGNILRYMFPCNGLITVGCIRFGTIPFGGAEVTTTISNLQGSNISKVNTSKIIHIVEPKLSVIVGDCLDIDIEPLIETTKITEVRITLLWVPSIKAATMESYLISELEKTLESLGEET